MLCVLFCPEAPRSVGGTVLSALLRRHVPSTPFIAENGTRRSDEHAAQAGAWQGRPRAAGVTEDAPTQDICPS